MRCCVAMRTVDCVAESPMDAISDDAVSTFFVVSSAPWNPYEVCAVGRIEMSGPIKSGFVHATRGGEASIQEAESRGGGVVGRKTGPGEPVEMVSGSSLS